VSRSRITFILTVLLLSLPASLLATARGSSLTTSSGSVAIRRLNPDSAHLRSYWTAARMRNATPVDVLELSRAESASASRSPVRVDQGRLGPGSVPPTAPDGSVDLGSGGVDPASSTRSAKTLASFTSGALNPAEYRTFPHSTIGRIFFTDPSNGENYACSGTAVTSSNASVVWTAGHCVHGGGSGKSFYTNWIFVPSYVDRSAPAGTWPALQLLTPQQWSQDGNLRYDMAAAVVATRGGQRLTSVTGGRGIQWNLPRAQSFSAYGYPAASPFTGERIHYCVSGLDANGNPPGPGPQTLGIGCDMTQGSSGGGWIVQSSFLNSDISYGIEGQPGVLYGPYFGDAAATVYESASTSTLPGPLPEPDPTPAPTATPTPVVTPPTDPPVTEPPVTEPPVTPPLPGGSPTPEPTETPGDGTPPAPGADTIAPSLTEIVDRPDPFTPNGDGVKDKVKFLFTLSEPSKITLTIFKPGGTALGYLLNGVDAPQAGRYLAKWNGKVGPKVVRRGTYKYVIAAVDEAGNKGSVEGTVTVRP
jgi:V8-like Glu-specific endopeptidase